MWAQEEHPLSPGSGSGRVSGILYSGKRITCQLPRRGMDSRGGERGRGRHSYYAALRKDCRGRLPFIRGKHGAADKLLLHVRSPLHRD